MYICIVSNAIYSMPRKTGPQVATEEEVGSDNVSVRLHRDVYTRLVNIKARLMLEKERNVGLSEAVGIMIDFYRDSHQKTE